MKNTGMYGVSFEDVAKMSAAGAAAAEAGKALRMLFIGRHMQAQGKRIVQNLRVDPKLRDLRRECKEEVRVIE